MSDRRTLSALAVALGLAVLWVLWFSARAAPGGPEDQRRAGPQRIVSASTRADQILWHLIRSQHLTPERLVAVTGISQRSGPPFDRFSAVERLNDLEVILGLKPDLVLANGVGDGRSVARLREAGVEVLDLGPLGGLDTFLDDIVEIGRAVGSGVQAGRLAEAFLQSMRAVAADVPRSTRPRGLVLIPYDESLFGGAKGSSYHDVLIHGGLRDAATEAGMKGWPRLTPSRVLELQPDWILTQEPDQVCKDLLGEALNACPERVVALPADVLGDPGLGMLDAATAVRREVHGLPAAP